MIRVDVSFWKSSGKARTAETKKKNLVVVRCCLSSKMIMFVLVVLVVLFYLSSLLSNGQVLVTSEAQREKRERGILVRKTRTKPTNAMIDSETLPPTTTSPFCLPVEKIRAVSSSRFRNLLFRRRLWFIFVVYEARGHRGAKISYTTWTETMGRKPDQLALAR